MVPSPTDLFQRGGLQQDTGLLRERWGQEGSTPVNISQRGSSDISLYTVTAGKVLYITDIVVTNRSGDAGIFILHDGGIGGTQRYAQTMSAVIGGSPVAARFGSPLVFDTAVYFEEFSTVDVNITLTGWEEDEN